MVSGRIWLVSSGLFGEEFTGGHHFIPLRVKYSAAMVNRCWRGPDSKAAYELREERKFARAPPHYDPW